MTKTMVLECEKVKHSNYTFNKTVLKHFSNVFLHRFQISTANERGNVENTGVWLFGAIEEEMVEGEEGWRDLCRRCFFFHMCILSAFNDSFNVNISTIFSKMTEKRIKRCRRADNGQFERCFLCSVFWKCFCMDLWLH